jgi:hypothetical protein
MRDGEFNFGVLILFAFSDMDERDPEGSLRAPVGLAALY